MFMLEIGMDSSGCGHCLLWQICDFAWLNIQTTKYNQFSAVKTGRIASFWLNLGLILGFLAFTGTRNEPYQFLYNVNCYNNSFSIFLKWHS